VNSLVERKRGDWVRISAHRKFLRIDPILEKSYVQQLNQLDPEASRLKRLIFKYRPFIAVFVAWLPLMATWWEYWIETKQILVECIYVENTAP